ncbi:hypothetical protein G9G63_06990 [Paenibacillus sp. EKM202P]|uniref:hypothetical protein n=1 Tax=unclassified Paenibacillus TaxID=185978 RepID=UPI0013ED7363|nr:MULTISPECIES: hypothetical protein [unclassified Paenibacillus]KAF6565906.1 hypothetical protein G9G63_06990 [Paenibacillus sp. EKM202P]KAF6572601.1 hypothetical protein G9G64_02920 [Paenibacillus sp. EKM207P]
MASEKTPNLGLNQIDRTSPKTTYFDLEKYLDQNWRSVDEFAGGVDDSVNEIKKRLDTTERKAVTLEPGVQIVHAEKAAPFSLTGLSGRTLVNLLGRMGSCETVSDWSSNVAIAIDNNNKTNGSSSFKITLGSVPATASASFLTTPGRKYIAIADVKSGNTSKVAISINGIAGAVGNEVTSGSVFAPSVVRFTAKEYFHILTITGTGATGNTFNMDSVRIYEISDADYAVAASLTPAQAAAKYPYVDSVMPVRNPYAIRYGENLLPSFYEWSAKQGTPAVVSEKSVTVTLDNKIVHTVSPLVSGQKYTVSVQSGGATGRITVTDEPESAIVVEASGSGLLSATFTATSRAANIRLLGTSSTAVTMSNPMLNIGSTVKPFKPREDSMLALQTDLYADPVTGSNTDTVFERDGQYFKSKKWHRLALDGSFSWGLFGSYTGYKVVGISGLPLAQAFDSLYVAKFDGKILTKTGAMTAADNAYFRQQPTKDAFDVSIPTADSGWGDSYTPTVDEIKAYFMGWKIYDSVDPTGVSAYNRTDGINKAWTPLDSFNGSGYNGATTSVPTVTADKSGIAYTRKTSWTPYQLVYQLASPTVEPIVSEGQLSFVEGDNQVEVGTGIVLRERSGINTMPGVYAYVNAEFPLKYKPRDILAVYKNGKKDSRWEIVIRPGSDVFAPIGIAFARLVEGLYDPADSFSTTYLMTDASPVVPFTGSYAANEKTLLADLVNSVQQNASRVSVLENKKVDKDNTAWLTPTLLNGAANTSANEQAVQYLKTSDGYVMLRGVLNIAALNTMAFRLPVGYRPLKSMRFVVSANQAFGQFLVGASGDCFLSFGSLTVVDLSGIVFLAEQ